MRLKFALPWPWVVLVLHYIQVQPLPFGEEQQPLQQEEEFK